MLVLRADGRGRVVERARLAGGGASWVLGAHSGRVIARWRSDGSQRLLSSHGRVIGRLPVNCSSVPYDYGPGATGPRQPVVCFPLGGRPVVARLLTWKGVVQHIDVATGQVRRIRDVGRNVDPSALLDEDGRYLYATSSDPTRLRSVDLRTGASRVVARTGPERAVLPVCLTADGQLIAVTGELLASERVRLTPDRLVRVDLSSGRTVARYRIRRDDLPVQSARSGLLGCTGNGRWLIAGVGHPAHLVALRPATMAGHRLGPDRPVRPGGAISDNT